MQFDNPKELVGSDVRKWAAEKGIVIEMTAPYSPAQNGIAEQFSQTLMELTWVMLIAKDLPAFL